MVITLFMGMAFIPDLLMSCTNSNWETHAPPCNLASRVHDHRSSLICWFRKWQCTLQPILTLLRHNTIVSMNKYKESNKLLHITGSYLSCLILSNRLMTALGQDAYGSLEAESCSIGSQILYLNSYIQGYNPQGSLYLTCSLKIAETTLLTTAEWANWACSSTPEVPNCIPKHVFMHWSSLLGRGT